MMLRYQNPRKGTETPNNSHHMVYQTILLRYQNPRKGTETNLKASASALACCQRTKIPVRGLKLSTRIAKTKR